MNNSAHDSKIPSASGLVSQVASHSIFGKKLITVFFGIIILLMLIWSFMGNGNKSKQKASGKANYHLTETQDNMMFSDEHSELNENMRKMKDKLELEKLAQQQKLYRMRQGAPIEMYASSQTSGVIPAIDSALTSGRAPIASSAGSNLPLTAQQIDRLKSTLGVTNQNSQFQQDASHSSVETVEAGRISHTAYTVTQGTLIPGSLETAINSDLPGMVKANVSMDIYAASGNRVLIPKGSTLIGQYNSGISMGQQRVFVVWTRLIRPDGINVMLGSPGTDALGEGGMGADKLDTHFWSRFGQASLLSIVGAGISNVDVDSSDQYNSASAYRTAIADNFQNIAGQTLASTMNIKPTVHIYQGAKINVFVNRDLSFYDVLVAQ